MNNNLPKIISILKGGPGSGHKGHAGIPGKRGGSAPKGMVGFSDKSELDKFMLDGFTEEDDEEYVSNQTEELKEAYIQETGDIEGFEELEDTCYNWGVAPDYENAKILQKGAEQAFQLPHSEILDAKLYNPNADFSKEQDLSRVIYQNTQIFLKSKGFGPDDKITLFRGTDKNQVESGKIRTSVLDSWTTSKEKAGFYVGRNSKTGKGYILTSKVPVRDIFALPQTGLGIPSAKEVVIFGSKSHEAMAELYQEPEENL